MITIADLRNIKDEKDFSELALQTFFYQYNNNKVYKEWCDLTLRKKVQDISDIPFLPVSFFKTHDVTCLADREPEDYFLSSGTTDTQRSLHKVYCVNQYIENTFDCFEQFFDNVEKYCYICLLPNYLEQAHSSLICMMNAFVEKSKYKQSGFFKDNLNDVVNILEANESKGIKTVLFGVTYALLDLINIKKMQLRHTVVFETGGMKGRRKEIAKNELHAILRQGFGVKDIASEYGMCELFSQAYSLRDGLFAVPKQMRVFIRSVNDPMGEFVTDKRGIINIMDLANQNTCAFIQTEDVGIGHNDRTFEIVGRLDHSAIRGCNLMYDL